MKGKQIGAYLLGSELGCGGMGRVYRAEVVGNVSGVAPGRTVALKIIHPHLLEQPGFFKRFLREAEIGRSVRHPNVVRCLDFDALIHEGRQLNFLVMEFVEGQTVRSLLAELERVPEDLCRHLGRDVAQGLAAIHAAGVVHRDLKPENVLITPEHAVKIMDLGVARVMEETLRLSQSGGFIGTVEYAAPEQFRTDAEVDGRADLYALGVMLYELSTGRHPYREKDPYRVLKRVLEETPPKVGELNPQLSSFFEEVVATLLAKDREDRFASAQDLLKILVEGEKSAWWQARAQALRVETKRPLRRIRIPRETALYGREDELARLRQVYARVKDGHGQVLLVEGEAGIGKTRLLDEFVGELRAAGEDVNFLFGSYPPGGAATASGAWSTAYREHFGSEELEDRLQGYLSITPALIPAFAALLRGEPPPAGQPALAQESLQTVFVHATRALAAERPTIVLIEDLHFAPEEGRALFASLALAVPEHRILLLGTARPGLPEAWRANLERLEQTGAMALPRLGPKDLTKLLVDAFRSESLATELSYRIAAKSDGNPFFVFEIIRGLREGQFITRKPDGSWITSKEIVHIEVPSSVLDLVKARVFGLSEEDRDLLDVASCFGYEFDPVLVAEAAGAPAALPVLKRLAQIERQHQLVRSAGSNYVFDHHQVQEALYGSLSEPLRRAYHAAIGQVLEARGSEDVAAICGHHLKGDQGQRALPHLDAAVDQLTRDYAAERAIELLELALLAPGLLAGVERGEVLLRKSTLGSTLGRTPEAWSAAEAALAIADATSDLLLEIHALQVLGSLQQGALRFEEAERSYARALRVAQETNQLVEVGNALHGAGDLAYTQERNAEARAYYDRALVLANEIGDQALAARACQGIARTLHREGRYEESGRRAREAMDLHRAVGDRSSEASSMNVVALALRGQGKLIEACEWLEQCLALCVKGGYRQLEASAVGSLGVMYKGLDRRQDARRCYEHALDLARQMGNLTVQWKQELNLGIVLREEGRLPESSERFERAIALARQHANLEGEAYGWMGLGTIAALRGNWAEAREHLDRALLLADQIGDGLLAGYAAGSVQMLFRYRGEWEKALEQSERLLAEAGENVISRASRGLQRAGVLLDLGDVAGAREDIRATELVGQQSGPAGLDESVLFALGLLSEASSEYDEAERSYRTLLQRARDTGDRIDVMEMLLVLGDLLMQKQAGNAVAMFDEAASIAEDAGLPQTAAYAACMAALSRDEDAGTARRVLAPWEENLDMKDRMRARWRLWQASGDPADLAEAKRLLQYLVDHAPARYRETMIKNVPMYQEIAAARPTT